MTIDNRPDSETPSRDQLAEIKTLPDGEALVAELTPAERTGVFIKIGRWINKNWIHRTITAAGGGLLVAGIGAGVAGGAGVFNSPDQTKQSGPAKLPSSSPEASKTPEATPTASTGMTQEQIAAYEKKIENGEFFNLSKTEQLTYWTELASGKGDNMSFVDFTNDYALTSHHPDRRFTTPSLNNTPSQVENIGTNAIRFALSLDIKSPDAQAAMYAVFFDNSADSHGNYAGFKDYLAKFPATMSGRLQGSKNVIAEAPIIDEENTKVQYDSNKQPYMDIKTNEPDGSVKTTRYFYIELPESQLEGVDGMWIQG